MPPLVMLIRHAEKPVVGRAPNGVTADGSPDPESLTPRGWQRAGALVGLFSPDPSRATGLPTPTHLFASQVGPHSSSRRPLETIQPLADRLGLTVDVRFLKEELGQLAAAILAIDGVVLVSWEHHLIPSIANMLIGDTTSVPQVWPDDRFDVVWLIDRQDPTKPATIRQVPELLLNGDQATVIEAQTSL
jgi:broad specificity phosphatase PhoE